MQDLVSEDEYERALNMRAFNSEVGGGRDLAADTYTGEGEKGEDEHEKAEGFLSLRLRVQFPHGSGCVKVFYFDYRDKRAFDMFVI